MFFMVSSYGFVSIWQQYLMISNFDISQDILIFKFREDKSNNELREILKCLRKTANFFAKQITHLEFSDHALQNDIYVYVLRV